MPTEANLLINVGDVQGPATHAILIGVGAYPHLVGGSDALSSDHEGMGQLSSPPVSARRFAEWIAGELNDPDKPLATVSVLASASRVGRWRNPRTGDSVRPARATMPNVKRAVRHWKDRSASPDDRLLFYFCGHGISRGPDLSLLLADFGEDPGNPLEGAIDFSGFHLGMESCPAREQCYFIDACRANSETTLGANGYMGDPIVMPRIQDVGVSSPQPREAPIYYSTIAGEDAYGRPGKPSPFTDALLKALRGAGSDDSEGDWRVDTTRLKQAVDYYMLSEIDAGASRAQVPATNNLTTFFLHHLDRQPVVPVLVGCRPEDANTHASFSCLMGTEVMARRAPGPGQFEIELPTGSYEFVAEFPGGGYTRVSANAYVRPVYRKVPLPVIP